MRSENRREIIFILVRGGGGQRALFNLSFRHATTKTWAYFGKFGFFRKKIQLKKYTLPRPNHFFKILWEIHFLTWCKVGHSYQMFPPETRYCFTHTTLLYGFTLILSFVSRHLQFSSGPHHTLPIVLTIVCPSFLQYFIIHCSCAILTPSKSPSNSPQPV